MSIISRFLNVFRSKALEQDLDDELRFHLEERAARNLQSGMDEDTAGEAARRQFGDIVQAKNEMREVRMMNKKVIGAFALGVTLGVAVAVLPRAAVFHRSPYKVIRSSVVLRKAKLRDAVEAIQSNIGGTVVLECIGNHNGECYAVRVIESKP
jgi:hypothetical protein